MINLYSGTPGSGKSLYATYQIIDYLKLGKGVIANFPINTAYFGNRKVNFTYQPNNKITVKYLVDYAKKHHKKGKENQTLLVIDEAGSMFNSRDFKSADRDLWIRFFSQHRKLGYSVVLISQYDRMLDRQIRCCLESEFKFRALRNYKIFGFFLDLLFGGLFVYVEYWYNSNLKIGTHYFTFKKKKAKIYDSFMLFENSGGGETDIFVSEGSPPKKGS